MTFTETTGIGAVIDHFNTIYTDKNGVEWSASWWGYSVEFVILGGGNYIYSTYVISYDKPDLRGGQVTIDYSGYSGFTRNVKIFNGTVSARLETSCTP